MRSAPSFRVISGVVLLLAGSAVGNQAFNYGKPFDVAFTGRWTTDRFVLRGSWGGRDCTAELARR
mgnify:CR=1 FL=1